jgi:hypothetical protein
MARIMVGLPVTGGYYPQMMASVIALLQENFGAVGAMGDLDLRFVTLANEALISRGRNSIATKFLESDCEYLLSIDSDIEFPASAVERLVAHDKDVIAAPYTIKGTPRLWTVRFIEGMMPPFLEGVLPVRYVSGGFVLVKRRVFEALADDAPRYFNKGQWHRNFYQPYVHEVIPGEPEYLPEDWAFCQRARDKGFEVFCDFDIELTHWGMNGYTMPTVDGRLPSHPAVERLGDRANELTSLEQAPAEWLKG